MGCWVGWHRDQTSLPTVSLWWPGWFTLIREIWIECINDRIWCSNRYARRMMDLGLEPPDTGRIALNPWADFNISGQFLCESFGIISPGMPQTAGRVLGSPKSHT